MKEFLYKDCKICLEMTHGLRPVDTIYSDDGKLIRRTVYNYNRTKMHTTIYSIGGNEIQEVFYYPGSDQTIKVTYKEDMEIKLRGYPILHI